MKTLSINEMITTGKWLLTMNDNSKIVIDFDKKLYDSYEWYKAMGTLEYELIDEKELFKMSKSMKRIEVR